MHKLALGANSRWIGILQQTSPSNRGNPEVAAYYDLLDQKISDMQVSRVPVYSFDHLLDNSPQLFMDIIHTSEEGHPIIAKRIADTVLENEPRLRSTPGARQSR
jgi:hypothetical protein